MTHFFFFVIGVKHRTRVHIGSSAAAPPTKKSPFRAWHSPTQKRKNFLEKKKKKKYCAPSGRVSKKPQKVPQNRVKPSAAEVSLHQQPATEPEGSVVRQRHGVPTAARESTTKHRETRRGEKNKGLFMLVAKKRIRTAHDICHIQLS